MFLLISGLIAVTGFLWIVDRTHHTGVHDLEGKTIKLFIMLCVVLAYFIAIHKLIAGFQSPLIRTQSSPALDDDSDQFTHPAIIADFIKKRRKGRNNNKLFGNADDDESSRPINVASDGINYYVVLLESPYKTGQPRYVTRTTSKRIARLAESDNFSDADDEDSCSSITQV